VKQPVAPGDSVGPFVLEHSISGGRGGMSEVYLAHDAERPRYKAAVKVQHIQPENRAAYQDLLRQEAEVLQQARHPSIVRVFPMRLGEPEVRYAGRLTSDEGVPAWYYAMEFIDGGSLEAFIRKTLTGRSADFTLAWRIELFLQLATGVHYLHQLGIAHCDLKPDNVLFRLPPDPHQLPSPTLIDFGSATAVPRLRHLTASLGYSPPEVILALERRDIPLEKIKMSPPKIDVWSLGAILYELLTGGPLIDRSRTNIATTLIRGKLAIASVASHHPEAGSSLDRLLAVMLRRDPQRRPPLKDVIVALEEKITTVRPPRIAQFEAAVLPE
jgi:serine/threonine protein kinase